MLAEPDRDAIEVSDDLVTVSKGDKDVGKADVAGIEIRVVTDSPVPVAFQLVEQFPEGVSMDDLAVHPQFSPEKWTISESERRMVFEDVVEPDEEVVTLYGVLEAKYDSLDPFLAEPTIATSQQVDPGTSSEGTERLFRGGAVAGVADAASADGAIDLEQLLGNGVEPDADESDAAEPEQSADAAPTVEARFETAASADVGPDESAGTRQDHPTGAGSVSASASSPSSGPAEAPTVDIPSADDSFLFRDGESETADDDPATAVEPADESPAVGSTDGSPKLAAGSVELGNSSVVTAFIEELEDVGDEKLAALKDALDLEPAESMRLRVSHLQSEVASLAAYADEFERFVDEEGSLSGVLDEFRDDVDRLEDSVDDLRADARAAAEERTALQENLDRLEREIETLRETHEASVGQLSSRVDDVADESVGADEVAAVREELRAERAWRRKVVSSLEALAEDAATRDLEA